MDQPPNNRNDCLDQSPAARVKNRHRARRRRASSKDSERPATTRRRETRSTEVTAEAKFGAQAGGVPRPVLLFSKAPMVEQDTQVPISPPLSSPFDVGSPQESWMETTQSPSPKISGSSRPHPASFYLPSKPTLYGIAAAERTESAGRTVYFGEPAQVSLGQARNTPNPLTNYFESLTQDSHDAILPLNQLRNDAMGPLTDSSVSEAHLSGFSDEVHCEGELMDTSMIQVPVNGERHVYGTSSGSSSMPLFSTNKHYTSPYSPKVLDQGSKETGYDHLRDLKMDSDKSEAAIFTEWQPAGLLSMESCEPESQYALLVLNQPIRNTDMLRLVWNKAFFRIAADGGANRLSDAVNDPCFKEDFQKIGLEVICGDLDSIFSRVREQAVQRGTKIVENSDQNSTDFSKCVNFLRESIFPGCHGASNILCLGGLGGRVDQGLSQLHHLYMEQQDPHYNNGRVYLLSTEAITFVLKKGSHRIRVHDPNAPILGKHIGIIPLKEPSIITTRGLQWDVTDWTTEFGGQMSTSNLVREDFVEITTTRDVLFTIDLDFPPGNHKHPELRQEMPFIVSMEDDMFLGIETNRYSY